MLPRFSPLRKPLVPGGRAALSALLGDLPVAFNPWRGDAGVCSAHRPSRPPILAPKQPTKIPHYRTLIVLATRWG